MGRNGRFSGQANVPIQFTCPVRTTPRLWSRHLRQRDKPQRARADEYIKETLDSPTPQYRRAIETLSNGLQMINEARAEIRPPMSKSELDEIVDRLVLQHLNADQINRRLREMSGTDRLKRVNVVLSGATRTVDGQFKKLADCFRSIECGKGREFDRMCTAVARIRTNIAAINAAARSIPGVNFNASGAPPMLGGVSMDADFDMLSRPSVEYLARSVCAAS
jgi:hypothetical protein